MTPPLIIIGAGLAGWSTAREFRKLDRTTPVMLITADSGDFYAKPSLSNAFAQGRSPAQLVSIAAAKMATLQNVTLLHHTRVSALDASTRTVHTAGASFAYHALVLASGAQAIRVPLAGDAADQVQSINSLDDFSAFYARLNRPDGDARARQSGSKKHLMIMGAGLIGCEFANDLAGIGHQVSVADPASGPIAALLPAPASAQLRQALSTLGVQWHFGSTVCAVKHSPAAGGPALQVELSNGQTVRVDAVLSAIGLRADTALARAAGLRCERGVLVDELLQTSQAHIYALGDVAQYATGRWGPAHTGVCGGHTLPYVMPIMNAARALAATLAGTPTPVNFPLMPVLIKTPALPIIVAAPAPGTPGDWQQPGPGVWQFKDAQNQIRGFVLTGPAIAQRAEQARQVQVA